MCIVDQTTGDYLKPYVIKVEDGLFIFIQTGKKEGYLKSYILSQTKNKGEDLQC